MPLPLYDLFLSLLTPRFFLSFLLLAHHIFSTNLIPLFPLVWFVVSSSYHASPPTNCIPNFRFCIRSVVSSSRWDQGPRSTLRFASRLSPRSLSLHPCAPPRARSPSVVC